MSILSRRQFLASASIAGITSVVGAGLFPTFPKARAQSTAASAPTVLRAIDRTIEVKGKPAKVFGLHQPNGTSGVLIPAGRFLIRLENRIGEPTLIHWHGLLPPYGQDGVPDMPQPLLASGASYDYDFPLETPGTHWMHAHTLQEQQLLAAPLIVTDPAEASHDEQQVVVLLHDFSFKSPEELLAGLKGTGGTSAAAGHGQPAPKDANQSKGAMSAMPGHNMPGHTMSGTSEGAVMDLNDIEYDAYLANDRTLDDPEVFRVESGGRVRLRLINGATATAFWIDLGGLSAEAIAVDGNPIFPMHGSRFSLGNGTRFPLGMGQRVDVRIRLPKREGAWPILALREGAIERTGFILATKAGRVHRLSDTGEHAAVPLDLSLETELRAERPLATKAAARRETVVLGGDMAAYVWTLDGRVWGQHRPIEVRPGERVEMTIRNQSMMGHPMHLHGHHFQVVAVGGRRIAGAVRDTVWLPPEREITIAFDAKNPGTWAFHCHHLYHMATGMMTVVRYQA